MTEQAIPDDIALRIGLAARALQASDATRLLGVLDDAIGLPPTVAKLEGLSLKQLKSAADGALSDIDTERLKEALALLKGTTAGPMEPAPPVEAYAEGDMAGSIRVACASNGGERLDGHFGSCRRFLVYQVSNEAVRLVDVRDVDDDEAEDKNAARASLITDCQVLYVTSIGGPAAAKVVKLDIHPIKLPEGGSASEQMASLQRILGDRPPPWLAKVMGQAPDERVRFERGAEDA